MLSLQLDGFLLKLVATFATNPLHLILAQLLYVADPFKNIRNIVDPAFLNPQQFRGLINFDDLLGGFSNETDKLFGEGS